MLFIRSSLGPGGGFCLSVAVKSAVLNVHVRVFARTRVSSLVGTSPERNGQAPWEPRVAPLEAARPTGLGFGRRAPEGMGLLSAGEMLPEHQSLYVDGMWAGQETREPAQGLRWAGSRDGGSTRRHARQGSRAPRNQVTEARGHQPCGGRGEVGLAGRARLRRGERRGTSGPRHRGSPGRGHSGPGRPGHSREHRSQTGVS